MVLGLADSAGLPISPSCHLHYVTSLLCFLPSCLLDGIKCPTHHSLTPEHPGEGEVQSVLLKTRTRFPEAPQCISSLVSLAKSLSFSCLNQFTGKGKDITRTEWDLLKISPVAEQTLLPTGEKYWGSLCKIKERTALGWVTDSVFPASFQLSYLREVTEHFTVPDSLSTKCKS